VNNIGAGPEGVDKKLHNLDSNTRENLDCVPTPTQMTPLYFNRGRLNSSAHAVRF
jgi:hypothetical protein